MKILNLYGGIGGNRKLWGDKHQVTMVEIDANIAKIYQEHFPNDTVIIGDAHEYLLEHYKEYDFIWSFPPCPTHSDIRRLGVDIGTFKAVYPDMTLYQEIILLSRLFKGKYVIENVTPYYEPLIEPQYVGRHCFWANFKISNIHVPPSDIKDGTHKSWSKTLGFKLDRLVNVDKRKVLRNCVYPPLALHIFKCAFKDIQQLIPTQAKSEGKGA